MISMLVILFLRVLLSLCNCVFKISEEFFPFAQAIVVIATTQDHVMVNEVLRFASTTVQQLNTVYVIVSECHNFGVSIVCELRLKLSSSVTCIITTTVFITTVFRLRH